jgi:hypothetical protein
MLSEITKKRTYKSKTFSNGDGTFSSEIHCGHIHYKNGSVFEDVDFTIVDMGTYWQMKKASYNLYVAKNFREADLIRYDNKYDGANHTIYFTAHSLQWIHKTTHDRTMIKAAQSVTGVMDNDEHTITYSDAFGSNVDFVIELRRRGFRKYIRFNTKPTLNPPTDDHVPVILFKYKGDGLTVKAAGETVWDNVSFYEGIEGFEISEVQAQYKSYLRKAFIWDSSDRENMQKVKLFFEKRAGVLWQAKVLPKSYFADATYPVMADTDIYVDSGDASVTKFANSSAPYWDEAHDATSGTAGSALMRIRSYDDGATFAEIGRGFLMFDTSSIPAAATISAASLNVYGNTTNVDDDDAQAYISVVQTFQATWNTIIGGDFNQCGDATDNPTEGIDVGDREAISGISTVAYTVIPLNSTGIGWIAKSGETKPVGASASGKTQLGLREGHDIEDVVVVGQNRVVFHHQETAGTSQDPYLSVTYTIPGIPILRRRRECA